MPTIRYYCHHCPHCNSGKKFKPGNTELEESILGVLRASPIALRLRDITIQLPNYKPGTIKNKLSKMGKEGTVLQVAWGCWSA